VLFEKSKNGKTDGTNEAKDNRKYIKQRGRK
jgi:hypothetical protein